MHFLSFTACAPTFAPEGIIDLNDRRDYRQAIMYPTVQR
jgi:hypothetical protein